MTDIKISDSIKKILEDQYNKHHNAFSVGFCKESGDGVSLDVLIELGCYADNVQVEQMIERGKKLEYEHILLIGDRETMSSTNKIEEDATVLKAEYKDHRLNY